MGRVFGLLLAIAIAAAAIVGCGSGGGSSTSTTVPTVGYTPIVSNGPASSSPATTPWSL
jgi:hypothetical protein